MLGSHIQRESKTFLVSPALRPLVSHFLILILAIATHQLETNNQSITKEKDRHQVGYKELVNDRIR
jgi:hypothetical protein